MHAITMVNLVVWVRLEAALALGKAVAFAGQMAMLDMVILVSLVALTTRDNMVVVETVSLALV